MTFNKHFLKRVSGKKEGGWKVCSIDCNRYGTVVMEVDKIGPFLSTSISFISVSAKYSIILCKYATVFTMRKMLLHASDFASALQSRHRLCKYGAVKLEFILDCSALAKFEEELQHTCKV